MPDIKKQTGMRVGWHQLFVATRKPAGSISLPSVPGNKTIAESDRKLVEQIFAGFAWHG